MQKDQKSNAVPSQEEKTTDLTEMSLPTFLKKGKPTSEKHYTVEQQWEIAIKHGVLITPTR